MQGRQCGGHHSLTFQGDYLAVQPRLFLAGLGRTETVWKGFSCPGSLWLFWFICFLYFKSLCLTLTGKETSLGKTNSVIRRIKDVHFSWSGWLRACAYGLLQFSLPFKSLFIHPVQVEGDG